MRSSTRPRTARDGADDVLRPRRGSGWGPARRLIGGAIVLTLLLCGRNEAGAQKVSPPTGVAVSSNTTTLTVSWNSVADAVQYVVNRRQPEQALATVAASPYTGVLPPVGVAYEYQVVSVGRGRNNTAASAWVPYTVPSNTITTSPGTGVILTEPRPTRGTITPVPAGPTSLSATSPAPGQITITWNEVANATAYRITRSSNVPEPEAELSLTNTLSHAGSMWYYTDGPVGLRWTYSYRVYALFGTTVSTSSPVASAMSIALAQPTGLKYTATMAISPTAGRDVTLSWTPPAGAIGFRIAGLGFTGTASVVVGWVSSYLIRNVPVGSTYRVCVGAIYTLDVEDPYTAPCIEVRL